jgi:hypothetical protein
MRLGAPAKVGSSRVPRRVGRAHGSVSGRSSGPCTSATSWTGATSCSAPEFFGGPCPRNRAPAYRLARRALPAAARARGFVGGRTVPLGAPADWWTGGACRFPRPRIRGAMERRAWRGIFLADVPTNSCAGITSCPARPTNRWARARIRGPARRPARRAKKRLDGFRTELDARRSLLAARTNR